MDRYATLKRGNSCRWYVNQAHREASTRQMRRATAQAYAIDSYLRVALYDNGVLECDNLPEQCKTLASFETLDNEKWRKIMFPEKLELVDNTMRIIENWYMQVLTYMCSRGYDLEDGYGPLSVPHPVSREAVCECFQALSRRISQAYGYEEIVDAYPFLVHDFYLISAKDDYKGHVARKARTDEEASTSLCSHVAKFILGVLPELMKEHRQPEQEFLKTITRKELEDFAQKTRTGTYDDYYRLRLVDDNLVKHIYGRRVYPV